MIKFSILWSNELVTFDNKKTSENKNLFASKVLFNNPILLIVSLIIYYHRFTTRNNYFQVKISKKKFRNFSIRFLIIDVTFQIFVWLWNRYFHCISLTEIYLSMLESAQKKVRWSAMNRRWSPIIGDNRRFPKP